MGNLHVQIADQLEERLADVKQQTGLSKSEIARRGLLEQLNQLESGSNE